MTIPRSNDRRGQSMVEFALILPLLILLLFGILDLGRAVYAYSTINNAAREGARWAIVDQTVADIRTEAANQGVGLGITPGAIEVTFVNNTDGSACTSVGQVAVLQCSANVRVPYQYQAVTPVLGALLGTITMAGESQFRVESNCQEPTAPTQCPLGN